MIAEKWYIHRIDPHYAATHADTYFEGWHYGSWENEEYPIEPGHFKFQHKHLDAAKDVARQLLEINEIKEVIIVSHEES